MRGRAFNGAERSAARIALRDYRAPLRRFQRHPVSATPAVAEGAFVVP